MAELFEDLAEQPVPVPENISAPRLRRPERDQLVLCPGSLDSLLPRDHMARTVEAFVGTLDMTPLYAAIRAREGRPGHPPADPKLIVALWLYATIDGVGSARELARLCTNQLPYQWLCGGVRMNYHSLADARLACADWLDQALIASIAALRRAGAITLAVVAQDGLRVRAAAGASSFRRKPRLEQFLTEARAQVETLKRELDGDAAASSKRQKAAAQRAAEDRARRLQAAVAAMPEAEKRATRNKKPAEKARVSTTDPEAALMKMPDGGFRPAYNTQLAAETEHGLIVGIDVTSTGADQPSLEPMVEQIEARTGCKPQTMLVDGGFFSKDNVTRLTEAKVELLVPPPQPKSEDRAAGEPVRDDTPAVAALRLRMADPDVQKRYRQRARWIEWVNAGFRNRGWRQVVVRGLKKVRAVAGWQAMAHNLSCIVRTKALADVLKIPGVCPA